MLQAIFYISVLLNLGANVDIVIPHRIEDGYGINERLIKRGIMIDCVDTILNM